MLYFKTLLLVFIFAASWLVSGCSSALRALSATDYAYNRCLDSFVHQANLPLWQQTNDENGQCISASIDPLQKQQSYQWFADKQCEQALQTPPLNVQGWCKKLVNRKSEFDHRAISGWAIAPATLTDSSVLAAPKQFPLMTRKTYREVDNHLGQRCHLTLDIYHPTPFAQSKQKLKPLLAIHGGSWRFRKKGFVMLQSQLAQMTSKGFVVFMPRYRLVGPAKDSRHRQNLLANMMPQTISACDGVTAEQQLIDIEAAYQWVKQHGPSYSAFGTPVLFGASAGGHLAARLALNHPDEIEKSVLLYAPIDFQRFAIQEHTVLEQSKRLAGSKPLQRYLQQSRVISKLPKQSKLITDNAMANRLNQMVLSQKQNKQENIPAFFAISGTRDKLVPVDQTLALCQAQQGELQPLAKKTTGMPGLIPAEEQLDLLQACGKGAFYLVSGGEHVMDICLPTLSCDRNAPRQQSVARALDRALAWLLLD